MTLFRIVAFLAAFACCFVAKAAVFSIPDDDSVVAIAIPDEWKPLAAPRDHRVTALSPDGTLQVTFAIVDTAKASSFQSTLMAGDPVRGLVPAPSSERRDTVRIAARDATDLTYRTSGSGRMRLIRMGVVPGKSLFITMIGPKEAFELNEDAIDSMLDEVKSLDN